MIVESEEKFVCVRRQWNDYRVAKYRISDLQNVHWSEYSGGVFAKAPQPFLHGYVQCDMALEGEVAHSGAHGQCPHSILVCVAKKDNDPAIFNLLLEEAGPKPRKQPSKARQSTAYHEAGHVVVTLHEKEQVESVSIAGRMTHTNPLRGIDVEWDDSPQTRSLIESRIRICLAGPIAQKRFNPRGFRRYHAEDDWKNAAGLALYLEGDEETTNACIQQLENQTHDIIDRHWERVEAIAEALIDQKKLSGAQVKEIIERTEEKLATP